MAQLFEPGALPREASRIIPGVVHLPAWLAPETQSRLVTGARAHARGPAAMRRPVLRSGQMSVWMTTLGLWFHTNPYRYSSRTPDGTPVPPVPDLLSDFARDALADAARHAPELGPWVENYRADTALINYYPPGSRMGMHRDDTELSDAPVVSFSIGDSAIFRIATVAGQTRPWRDVPLESGDALVFGGPARLAFHGVPRLIADTTPDGCGLTEGRINITVRQVTA